MAQTIVFVIVLLLAGFTARSCTRQGEQQGDPAKSAEYYSVHQNQALKDANTCFTYEKREHEVMPASKQRDAGLNCKNAIAEMGILLKAEVKRREKLKASASGQGPDAGPASASGPAASNQ